MFLFPSHLNKYCTFTKVSRCSRIVFKCSFKLLKTACGKLDKKEPDLWDPVPRCRLANGGCVYCSIPDLTSECNFNKYTENRFKKPYTCL